MDYKAYPKRLAADVARLRRRIRASGIPEKRIDQNLLLGTWNIRAFGDVYSKWTDNPHSPKRNLYALALIAEVVRRFDVIAIQEVKRVTTGIRRLVNEFLGSDWAVILSDVTAGKEAVGERIAYIYDTRRVKPSGLVGEIVLPKQKNGDPAEQFARTPYLVGFQAQGARFVLLSAHIFFGKKALDAKKLKELQALAEFTAKEISGRARDPKSEEYNLIVLGDFNIDKRSPDNPLFKAFTNTGLHVPFELRQVRSTYGTVPKHYDQIAWFMGGLDLDFTNQAGAIDFSGAVFQDLDLRQMSYRISDHFPLWVEFNLDRSEQTLATTLKINPNMPQPLDSVPD